MTQIRTACLFIGVILLQACSTPSPSQLDRPTGGVAKAAGWKSVEQFDRSSDLRNNSNNSSLYWARLSKSATGYAVTELSSLPLVRIDLSQEILVVDAKRKRAHPAFEARSSDRRAESSSICEKDEMQLARPYSACNSAFAGVSGAHVAARIFLGVATLGETELKAAGRAYREYLSDALDSAIDGEALNAMVPAAMEQRRLAQLDSGRIASERREAQATATRAEEARFAELLRNDEAISIKALSKLPRGYKDVCDFSTIVIATPRAPSEHDKLNCINFGEVASLYSLKQAGFNVTNIVERSPGDPRTTRYNVEKVR